MAITTSGTTLTFNDATTQTTAGLVSGGALGTPSSGALTNCTSVPVNQATGTLPVANGGTGATSLTANNVLLGNGTSALQVVAPGTNGNVLTSNGTTWQSTAPAAGGVTSLNGQTGAITDTNLGAIGSYISAVRAVTAGSPNSSLSANSTIAGSSLRYGWSASAVYGGLASAFQGTSRFGTNNSVYNSGGSSLSGTWRNLGTAYETDVDGESNWYPSLWVRIS
jgi:hypothetical protein